jgi:hypothetical protein
MRRTSLITGLLSLTLLAAGCSSEPAAAGSAATATSAAGVVRDDAAALADLQASDKWTDPRCRWLESGAWVLASVQEEALYRAASLMGFIEMTQAGQAYHLNRQAPAWKITLTDAGKAEAGTCSPTSKPTSWGVPVSKRQFTSGRFVEEQPGGRMVYAVDFAWVPTSVGDQVVFALTGRLAVENGAYRTKVYLRKGRAVIAPSQHGWLVDAIDDRGAERVQ